MSSTDVMAFGLVTVAVYPSAQRASLLCMSGWDEAEDGSTACPDWYAACDCLTTVSAGAPIYIDHDEDWRPGLLGDAFVARW